MFLVNSLDFKAAEIAFEIRRVAPCEVLRKVEKEVKRMMPILQSKVSGKPCLLDW